METKNCKKCNIAVSSRNRTGMCTPCYEKVWRDNNKDRVKNLVTKWRINNREKSLEYGRANYAKHKEKVIAHKKKRYQTEPEFKLRHNLRNRLNCALKRNYKSGSAVRDLGCSISELKVYLESRFTNGMTWENYGEWEIDHIIPLSSFSLSNREQFLKACHYTNLQPLWWIDNNLKSNK